MMTNVVCGSSAVNPNLIYWPTWWRRVKALVGLILYCIRIIHVWPAIRPQDMNYTNRLHKPPPPTPHNTHTATTVTKQSQTDQKYIVITSSPYSTLSVRDPSNCKYVNPKTLCLPYPLFYHHFSSVLYNSMAYFFILLLVWRKCRLEIVVVGREVGRIYEGWLINQCWKKWEVLLNLVVCVVLVECRLALACWSLVWAIMWR